MTAVWPNSLPQYVRRDSYGEEARMPNVEFAADTGPPIERPKGTVRLNDISAGVIMSTEQLATFEEFVFTDLGQATLDFFFPHPRRKQQVKVRFKGRPPYRVGFYAVGEWDVRFVLTEIG